MNFSAKRIREVLKHPRRAFLFSSAISIIFFFGCSSLLTALASPPTSPYLPGETLNPSCAPGDANCTVNAPLSATSTLSSGSILFVGNASGTVAQNNSAFFWDNSNGRLGVGTAQPSSTLHVVGGATIAGNATTTNLTISGITGTTQCLHVNANGVISGTNSECGSASSSVTINGMTATSYTFAAGNKLTLATSGPNTITFSLTTSSISQFANDSGFISTSTGNGLYLQIANNLSDLTNTSTARTNIGFSAGTGISISATGTIANTGVTGAAGSDTYVQFNNGGAFGGDANFTWASSTAKLTIASSSGSLLIGTSTNPTNSLFTIASSSNIFTVLKSGNVGIGTSTPSALLSVSGSGSSNQAGIFQNGKYLFANGTTNGVMNAGTLEVISTTGSNSSIIRWGPQFVDSGSISGTLGYAGSGQVNVNMTASNADLNLGAGTAAAALVVQKNTGNIGIATSSPLSLLSVAGVPPQTNTSTLMLLGNAAIASGAASGTYIGINAATGNNANFIDFQVNGVSKFKVASDGAISGSTIANTIDTTATAYTIRVTGSSAAQNEVTFNTNNNIGNSSGVSNGILFNQGAAPTATGVVNTLHLNNTINQAAGSSASGIIRGLYLNPTLTSAYDYRQLEVGSSTTGGTVWNRSTSTLLTNGYSALFNTYTLGTASGITSSSITNAYNLAVNGAPVSTVGSSTITNSYGLAVLSNNVSASTTNAYGLSVAAPTGATNNYAALFTGNVQVTGTLTDAGGTKYSTSTGGGTPGGSDTYVQFNNGGAFGGDANFTWASSTAILTLGSSTSKLIIGTSTTPLGLLSLNAAILGSGGFPTSSGLINLTNSAIAGGHASGTLITANLPSGSKANFVDFQTSSTSVFSVNANIANNGAYAATIGGAGRALISGNGDARLDFYSSNATIGGSGTTCGSYCLQLRGVSNNSANIDSVQIVNPSSSNNPTSGLGSLLNLAAAGSGGNFNPTSGNAGYHALTVSFKIIQSAGSGASGITRGIYISPVLTSAYDYRQLEVGSSTAGGTIWNMSTSTLLTNSYSALFNAYTLGTAVTSSSVTNAYNLAVNGAPVSTVGSSTITNSYALAVLTNNVSASTTNAYGLSVAAPTGATNNYGAAITSGGLLISTTTAATSTALLTIATSSNIFTVLNNGNVGVGTSTPSARFTVQGSGAGNVIIDQWGGSATYAGFSFNGSLSNTNYNIIGSPSDANLYINRAAGGDIKMGENNNQNQLVVKAGGNIGIGTVTPWSPLNIFGAPVANATSSMFLLGSNFLIGGNANGTFLAANPSSTFTGDFINFQVNSSSQFRVSATGTVQIAGNLLDASGNKYSTSTGGTMTFLANGSAFVTTSTIGFTAGANITITTSTNGTYTIAGSAGGGGGGVSTSSAGVINTIPIWTSASAIGNSLLTQIGGNTSLNLAGLPVANATSSLFLLGSNFLIGGNANGTFLAANPTSTFNGDFINFQVNSSTAFKIAGTGATTIVASSTTAFSVQDSGNNSVFTVDTTASSTNSGLDITAGNTQTADLLDFYSSSSVVMSGFTKNGYLFIGTTGMYGTTSTLTVCAQSNCTTPTATTSTNAVAFFASTDGTTSGASIIARGTITAGQADIGEYINIVGDESAYAQGDVIITATSSVQFEKSMTPYDSRLAGVITETAGLIAGGGADGHGSKVIALAGRIPVKITDKNGAIAVGDYLTSSDVPGVAMRSTAPGRVIGIALESWPRKNEDGTQSPPNSASMSGAGMVMMFVNPHFALGSLTDEGQIASSSWALAGTSANSQAPSSVAVGVLDQFTLYVKYAFQKLGATIADGVASVKQLVAEKVTTKQLCLDEVCIDRNQLKALLDRSGSSASVGQPSTTETGANTGAANNGTASDPYGLSQGTSTTSTNTETPPASSGSATTTATSTAITTTTSDGSNPTTTPDIVIETPPPAAPDAATPTPPASPDASQ